MNSDVVETHQDVLQNLELAVIRAYREDNELLDLDVLDGFDALIRRYASEADGRTPPRLTLGPKAGSTYVFVHSICEWQLGRMPFVDEEGNEVIVPEPLTIAELLACLKRLRKSARFWNEEAGRQGYLNYVSRFIG